MYHKIINPIIFINQDIYMNFLKICDLDITIKIMPDTLIEKYFEYPPEALIIGNEEIFMIMDIDQVNGTIPSGDIPLVAISKMKNNTLLKKYLALGGEAVILKDSKIIYIKGSATTFLGDISQYQNYSQYVKEILIYKTITNCFNNINVLENELVVLHDK